MHMHALDMGNSLQMHDALESDLSKSVIPEKESQCVLTLLN